MMWQNIPWPLQKPEQRCLSERQKARLTPCQPSLRIPRRTSLRLPLDRSVSTRRSALRTPMPPQRNLRRRMGMPRHLGAWCRKKIGIDLEGGRPLRKSQSAAHRILQTETTT
jgi:hypothetical protein